MKLGLQIPYFTWPGGPPELGSRLAEVVRTADDVGFSSIWVMDHFFQIAGIGTVELDMLEAYTALGFIAAHTSRARIGTMVTGVTYRHPAILVKQVTALDVLSGGRAWMGIGAALTSLVFLRVDLETSRWWIQLILLVRGWAFALGLVPLQAATFATIRPVDTGRASAVFNANRQVAASLGVALLGTVLTNRLTHFGSALGNTATNHGAVLAFHDAFIVAAALAVVGIFLSLLLDDKEAARAVQERVAVAAD